jgi:hypothetical protein
MYVALVKGGVLSPLTHISHSSPLPPDRPAPLPPNLRSERSELWSKLHPTHLLQVPSSQHIIIRLSYDFLSTACKRMTSTKWRELPSSEPLLIIDRHKLHTTGDPARAPSANVMLSRPSLHLRLGPMFVEFRLKSIFVVHKITHSYPRAPLRWKSIPSSPRVVLQIA